MALPATLTRTSGGHRAPSDGAATTSCIGPQSFGQPESEETPAAEADVCLASDTVALFAAERLLIYLDIGRG